MTAPPAAAAVGVTVPSATSLLARWRDSSRGKKIGVVTLLAVALYSLYRYFKCEPQKSDAAAAKRSTASSSSRDEREGSITSDAAADLRAAAASYGPEYRDRMQATTAVPTAASQARPFIGFSLADNIVAGALVVDGVFVGGPADQTGVDIDHELLSIGGEAATSIDVVRQLVARHCRAGQVTRMRLRREDGGATYEVPLWVMTADEAYRSKPYFFDTKVHHVRQSERMKQTWRPENSPKKEQR